MITELSKRISLFLCEKDIVTKETVEVYQYGFEVIISTLIGFFITILIGVAFHMIVVSLLYYFVFVVLRQFTGGYHADTYLKCNLIFAATTTFIFGMARIAEKGYYSIGFHVLLLFFAVITIWFKVPVENKNKPLSEKEKKRSHSISVIITLILVGISGFLYGKSILLSAIIAFTLFVIAAMVIIANPRRKEAEGYE